MGADANSLKFLKLLSSLDFDRKYYALCDAPPVARLAAPLSRAEYEAAVALTMLDFRFFKEEDTYFHEENLGGCALRIRYHSRVELIIYVQTPAGLVRDPFPVLARKIAESREATFDRSPPYPKPSFSDVGELTEIAQFGSDRCREIPQALIEDPGWGVGGAA